VTMTIPAELLPSIPAWAQMTPKRLAHVVRVAELAWRWSLATKATAVEQRRWLRAVWLHDALRDADPQELARWAGEPADLPVELLHGPAAARRAEADGEADRGVLDAVRYHSVGSAQWDRAGQVLYCADFLEPGRRFDRVERAALAERYPADPDGVFVEVVTRRLLYSVRSGWTIPEPTWRLWNSIARRDPGESR